MAFQGGVGCPAIWQSACAVATDRPSEQIEPSAALPGFATTTPRRVPGAGVNPTVHDGGGGAQLTAAARPPEHAALGVPLT